MLFQRVGEGGEGAVSEVENEGDLLVEHSCSRHEAGLCDHVERAEDLA